MTDGVTVDNRIAFGRPCIAGTGIATEIIAERFRAGDSIASLVWDYRVRQVQIEAALRYELLRRRPNGRRVRR